MPRRSCPSRSRITSRRPPTSPTSPPPLRTSRGTTEPDPAPDALRRMTPSAPPPVPPRLSARQQEELSRMSLMEHLEELRKRIIWSVLAISIAFFPCWAYYHEIYKFLVAPLHRIDPNIKLSFLALTDPFILYFKMAAYAAVFLAAPFVLYQLWAFISPGLYSRERRLAAPFIFFTSLFFICGGAFGYYVAFPMGASFLLNLCKDMQAVVTSDKYFRFLLT